MDNDPDDGAFWVLIAVVSLVGGLLLYGFLDTVTGAPAAAYASIVETNDMLGCAIHAGSWSGVQGCFDH